MKKRNLAALAAASAIVVSAYAQVSRAAIVTWDSSGATPATPSDGGGSWSTSAAKWSNGANDAGWNNGDAPVFGANNGAAGVVTIDDAAGGVTASGVTFNAAGSGNYTIAAAGADTLTLTSPIVTVNGATSPTISAPILGSTGITVAGTGTLNLAGANTYTGANLVSSGTLTLASGGTLGAAANTLTLGAASPGLLADATTVTANINNSVAVGGLTIDVNSTSANVLKIANGQTMIVNGAAVIGLGSATTATNTVVNTYTGAVVPGSGGELDINGSFTVGLPNTNATSTKNSTTVDLSALSTFKLNSATGTLDIGQGVNTKGTLTLASGLSSSNTINVKTINDGVSGSSNANSGCTLNLGSGTNVLQATTISIGTGKSGGVMQFVSSAPASASVTITGLNGSGTADITIGNETSGSATTNNSSLLLAGRTANIQAGTVLVAQSKGTNNSGTALGNVTFDTGTFNIGTLNMAIVNDNTASAVGATGSFTLGTNSNSTGVLSVSTAFVLASFANSNTGLGTAAGTFTINGGTANINTNITSTGTKGTISGAINLAGGTLDMKGNGIGTATLPITLTATRGTIQNLLQLNGGGALTKSGATTLVLGGVDSYTGPTNITAGTLDVDGTHTGGGLYTVSALATLGGDGSTTAPVLVNATGILSPGDSIHSLGVGSTTLNGTLNIELNDADPNVVDLLNVTGNLDISSATSAVSFAVTGTPTHGAYVFANYSGLTGSAFATVSNLPAGYSIDYNYQGANDIALVAAPVPEPSSIGLVLAGATGLVARRRRRA